MVTAAESATAMVSHRAKRGIINELHKQARKNFPRRRVYTKGIDDLWQLDLADLSKYARNKNNNNRFILTVIDVMSKHAWAVAVRNKTGKSVTEAMKKVFKQSSPRVPKNIQVDMGKEFYNSTFLALMRDYKINMYSSKTHLKASVVERFIKSLKNWMFKEFGVQGNYSWIKLLPVLLKRYNSRIHRTIGMRPKDVRKKHEQMLFKKLYGTTPLHLKQRLKFTPGDTVRVSKYKTQFDRGFTPSWSTELFTVDRVRYTEPPVYYLRDAEHRPIDGAFYAAELQKTRYPDTYLVERVLRRRGNKVYVKWLGFPSSHNSWV